MCRVTPRQRLIFLWYIQYFTCSTLSGEYICLAFKNVMYCAIHHHLIYWVCFCSMHCTSLPRVRITCQSAVLLSPALGLLQVPQLLQCVQPALFTPLTCTAQSDFFLNTCTASIRLNQKQPMTLIKGNSFRKPLSERKDWFCFQQKHWYKQSSWIRALRHWHPDGLLALFKRMKTHLGQLSVPFDTTSSPLAWLLSFKHEE